jgi:PEP-CTERM motif
MVTNARPRAWSVLLLLTALMLVHPPSARADRIDIDDPTLLGPVLQSVDLNNRGVNDYERLISEVRYAAGIYSYIFAVQTSPYFPAGFGQSEGEGELVSFAVTGHPLGGTWGAINSSNEPWAGESIPVHPTNTVVSMTPLHDGFLVVPERNNSSTFTVVYMQSPRPPSDHGILTYTGRSYCFSEPFCFDENGDRVYEYDSLQRDGAFVPTPEPGTIGLFGLGFGGSSSEAARKPPSSG